ncbi:MAG: hypothetical protein ACPGSG_04475 [Prolixibacteraceae bacterium]
MQKNDSTHIDPMETLSIHSFSVEELAEGIGRVLIPGVSDHYFSYGFCSDLMSDLLTIDTPETVLITGLITAQTIRTAHIAEIHCVIFVRNKQIPSNILHIAKELNISIIHSPNTMFHVCGILFSKGLQSIY